MHNIRHKTAKSLWGPDETHATITNIPIIDISPFFDGDLASKQEVARKFDYACEKIGFMIIVGHGVSEFLVSQASVVAQDFFALSHKEKMKVHMPGKGRGYFPLETESLATGTFGRATPGDLKESFNIGANLSQNLWPDCPIHMKSIWTDYFHVIMELCTHIMHIFAVALGLSERFFDNMIDKPKAVLRATNYPPLEKAPEPEQLPASPHTDYGTLTIISTSSETGLQVYTRSRQWIDVEPPPNSFIVNIGDLMMRWTNDKWISTLHRVITPPLDQAGKRRQSLVFFHNPNPCTLIKCLDCCCSPKNPPKYPPILAEEYLKAKSRRSLHLDQST